MATSTGVKEGEVARIKTTRGMKKQVVWQKVMDPSKKHVHFVWALEEVFSVSLHEREVVLRVNLSIN